MVFSKKYLLFFFLFSLCSNAKSIDPTFCITPEDFGCVSDKIDIAHDNSVKLQKAIDYAIENGLKLVSSCGKRYYIKESLVIKAPIDIDFGMGSLIATDTVSVIVINDGKARRWGGRIKGLKIDQNKKAKLGIYCKSTVKLHISDCAIVGIPWNGVGLFVEKGYENFVDNVHMEGGENFATGIRVVTHDCHFTDCAMIDCHVAIDNNGSNFYERIHAWMGEGGKWIDGSTFFRIGESGSVFLHQCFSDTFDRIFDVIATCRLFISQQKNYHNKNMWKNKKIFSPKLFSFKSREIEDKSYIVLDNSFIGGLYVDGKNMQSFSNLNEHHVIINNTYIE